MRLIFTRIAFRQFQKLSRPTQKRIDEKLCFYLSQKAFINNSQKI